jgi:hypothetical protein
VIHDKSCCCDGDDDPLELLSNGRAASGVSKVVAAYRRVDENSSSVICLLIGPERCGAVASMENESTCATKWHAARDAKRRNGRRREAVFIVCR